MGALVIKAWKAAEQPWDDTKSLIWIQGRDGGILSWFLSLIGYDPTTTLKVTRERFDLDIRSWSGWQAVILPLENLDYIFHGFYRPWKQALVLLVAWFFLLSNLAAVAGARDGSILIGLTALPLAGLYYWLARSFTLGVMTSSGHSFTIRFKRSILENQEINSAEAGYVCELLEYFRDERRQRMGQH